MKSVLSVGGVWDQMTPIFSGQEFNIESACGFDEICRIKAGLAGLQYKNAQSYRYQNFSRDLFEERQRARTRKEHLRLWRPTITINTKNQTIHNFLAEAGKDGQCIGHRVHRDVSLLPLLILSAD